jgi:hypothetical protein
MSEAKDVVGLVLHRFAKGVEEEAEEESESESDASSRENFILW